MDLRQTTGQIRGLADIVSIEADGLARFLPDATPYGMLERSARERPDAVALRYLTAVDQPERDVEWTYAQLVHRVRQAANAFRRLGVGADDSVAILMPHVPISHVALWGAETAGRACPINPFLRHEQLVGLLNAARAKVAVVLGKNGDLDVWDHALPAIRESQFVTHVFHADADDDTPGSDGSFEETIARERGDVLDFTFERDGDTIAAYFHTGGTTGAPKLALHTQRNQAFVARGSALMNDFTADDVFVNGFPLFHVAGALVYGLSMLSAGGTTLIPTRLGMRNRGFIASIWRQVERYGVTVIGGVPTIIASLNAVPVDADIRTMRLMSTGGSPLPTELADAFEHAAGKPIRNILGMTECAGVVTIEPFHGPRTPGSTGVRLPFTRVCIFREVDGAPNLSSACGADETGILALRGPNVSPGYSSAEFNAGTFASDGWLISGDLGHIDAAGRVYVTGRAKDVIIRGGHNIDPATIEDALLQHPDVSIAAAVGQPDAYAGEIPVAFVVLKPGSTADAETLRAFSAARVAEPAAAPKHVFIMPELPLTPIGKVYKPALRTVAAQRAMCDLLARAGIGPEVYTIAVSEAVPTIELLYAGDESRVRDALAGVPARFDVRLRGA